MGSPPPWTSPTSPSAAPRRVRCWNGDCPPRWTSGPMSPPSSSASTTPCAAPSTSARSPPARTRCTGPSGNGTRWCSPGVCPPPARCSGCRRRSPGRSPGGSGPSTPWSLPCPSATGRSIRTPRRAPGSGTAPCGARTGRWSADRPHPGERGHRQLAVRFHAPLSEAGIATAPAPSAEPEFAVPTRSASLWWLATAGTAWGARRCTDPLPQLLILAASEMRHKARGTSARLDLSASNAVAQALAALSGSVPEHRPEAA